MGNLDWQLDGEVATIASSLGRIRLDLTNPSAGLAICGDKIQVEPLFAFLISDAPLDLVVRGRDLILRFPPRKSDLVSYEVQYRISEDSHGVDMILSAQTELLESKPEMEVRTTCHAAELVTCELDIPGLASDELPCCVARPDACDASVLIMVHPSDFYRSAIHDSTIKFWVFPESLEKGVIRRARFRLRLFERSDDEVAALSEIARASCEAPPLTT